MKVKGIEELIKKINKLPTDIKNDVKSEIEYTADKIVEDAVNAVRVDTGRLKQSIGNYPKNGGLNYIVNVDADYAAYVEFGTGTKVIVPTELKDYAMQFKGRGEKQVNLPARPFFFPAYFKNRDKLIENLKKILVKNLDK